MSINFIFDLGVMAWTLGFLEFVIGFYFCVRKDKKGIDDEVGVSAMKEGLVYGGLSSVLFLLSQMD